MSWVTNLGQSIGGTLSGLPARLKMPGEDDGSLYSPDQANGITGQGPLFDPSMDNNGGANYSPSSLPPSIGAPPVGSGQLSSMPDPQQSQQPSGSTPPPAPPPVGETPGGFTPTITSGSPASSPLGQGQGDLSLSPLPPSITGSQLPPSVSQAQNTPAPPPPAPIAPPQPNVTPGSEVSAAPAAPPIQSASNPIAQGQGDSSLPAKPGSQPQTQALQFPQNAGSPQLIPRSAAQQAAGMGVPQQPQQPSLINQIQSNAQNPSPLPKPPSGWRTAAAIGAGMVGGSAFAPLIAYGPKGAQQLAQRNQQNAQQTRMESAQKVINDTNQVQNQADNIKSEAANRQLTRDQADRTAKETAARDANTTYNSTINNMRTVSDGSARILKPGEVPPAGYNPTIVTNPKGVPELWIMPDAKTNATEKDVKTKVGDEPLGDKVPLINQALTARYQVLHPKASLPEHYVLQANATQKDFERTDKLIEGEEKAFGTKENQNQTAELRKQTLALAASNRDKKDETALKAATLKAFTPALDSGERFNVMAKNYEDAVKNHDQQAMLSLLANHLGMTMGLQKGSRITKDIIKEAEKSRPWLQGLESQFDSNGPLSGMTLSQPQMRQMISLGRERFMEDIVKARSEAKYQGMTDDGPDRIPSKAAINHYISLAGGDVKNAQQLATADGWTIK